MTDQHGFGNHAAESAWSCQSNHNAQQMSEDEEVAHSGDGIKASKPPDCANFCNSPWTGERSHRAIPGSRLEIYKGASHGLFFTHRERLKVDLLEFIGADLVAGKTETSHQIALAIPGD